MEQRPLHHLHPPQDAKTLIQTDVPVTLREMLDLIDATDRLAESAHVMDKHVKQAHLAIEKQMEAVLRKQGLIVFSVKTALPWNAKVEVRYSRRGRSPDRQSFSFSFVEVHETKHFTVRDIALGLHYGDEFEVTGGHQRVESVRVVDPVAQRLLAAVDRDEFRTALLARDEQQLKTAQDSAVLMKAHEDYVKEVFTGVLFDATSLSWERHVPPGSRAGAAMLPPHAQHMGGPGARTRVRVGHGPVRLISFDGEVLAGLLSVSQADGDGVLLISIKHATHFWWWPGVEVTQAFQEFISMHMSPVLLQRMESPLRSSRMRFQIGPVSTKNHWSCAPSNREAGDTATPAPPGNPLGALYDEVWRKPYFRFETCQSLYLAMWIAEMRRAYSDRDMVIITQRVRDERRLNQAQHIVFNYLKIVSASFAAAFAVKGRFAKSAMSLMVEVGAHLGTYALLAERAKTADLEELKRIHLEMSLSKALETMFRSFGSATLDSIADALFEDGESARVASEHLISFMNAWPLVSEQRKQFADDIRAIVKAERREDTLAQEPAWVGLSRIKAYRRLLTDGEQAAPMTESENHVDRFLGAGRMQVTSLDELMRLPEGYCVALTYPDGTMFFSAVTSGSGKLLGSAVDDGDRTLGRNTALPTYRIGRVSQEVFEFLDDGRVRCGAVDGAFVEGALYVESLDDRRPDWRKPMPDPVGVWPRVPTTSEPSRVKQSEAESVRAAIVHPWSLDGDSQERRRGRSKRALEQWGTFVDAWYARAGRIVPGASSSQRLANVVSFPLPPSAVSTTSTTSATSTTSTASTPSTLAGAARPQAGGSDPLASAAAMAAHWNAPAFRLAFAEVLSRVRRGLMRWHLQASHITETTHRRLILRALRGDAVFRPVTVNAVRLPGVVGIVGDEGRLLISLTTCEVMALIDSGEATLRVRGNENDSLRRFVERHMSEAVADTMRGRDLSVVLASPDANCDTDRVTEDFRDQIELTMQQRSTVGDGILKLATQAAQTLPGVDTQSLIASIQGVTRALPNQASEVIYLNEPVDGPQNAPSLWLANGVGTAIREFFDDVFPRGVTDDSLSDATALAARLVESVQGCRIEARVSDDVASLVESGMGDIDFVAAMLAAGRGLQDGKFGAAVASMWQQIPGPTLFCGRQSTAPQLVRLQGTQLLRQVPRGYRILARPTSADPNAEGGYDDMLSLGGGRVAVVRNVGTDLAPRLDLTSIDLTRTDGDIAWSDADNAWRRDGETFHFWIESDTPGVFAEPPPPEFEAGSLNVAVLSEALLAHPSVSAMQDERSATSALALGGATAAMLDAARETLTGYGFTSIAYRLITSWSAPDQFRPRVSLAVIATGEGDTFRSWVTHGYVDRVVVDFLPRRTLGNAPPLMSDIYVSSVVDWGDFYQKHGAARCIKYVDFDTADAALNAARTYTVMPGALPGNFMPGGVLLRSPDWPTHATSGST
ncbi:hypothetical protein MB84_18750 [Pandoraea oxalativorans]|uniref:Uncharacterized protein n=2 Tax=Pandoraea oxalativorans TaxID=573737 RepID=A0A0E3YD45_9BURK|nr:hypothetical protein MB84_18750 [Pandoraea oxalativorans]